MLFLFAPFSLLAICNACTKYIDMYGAFVSETVEVNGRSTLYYELYISNPTSDSVLIASLDVLGRKDNDTLLSLSGAELINRLGKLRADKIVCDNLILPRDTTVIYIELSSTGLRGTKLTHHLRYTMNSKTDSLLFDIKDVTISVPDLDAALLGNPLDGGPWIAIYEPSWNRGHRRVFYTANGVARIPGRYAIDFMLLDSLGRFAEGNKNEITSYFGYDANVLAVADGIVVALRNDFFESPTLSDHPKYPPKEATGNYICLKISENRYVFYEHLKPRTIAVKVGQQVKKGQVIARVGFTGQTTGPHLHLHVANSPSPLGSEGLPFTFEKFKLLGHYIDFNTFGNERWIADANSYTVYANERPAPNAVIQF
uniref:Peptidase M23 n=1 Tax=Sphingobacterium sp. (strain 21) TaxID=743722 RepID=F4CE73_SPHS2